MVNPNTVDWHAAGPSEKSKKPTLNRYRRTKHVCRVVAFMITLALSGCVASQVELALMPVVMVLDATVGSLIPIPGAPSPKLKYCEHEFASNCADLDARVRVRTQPQAEKECLALLGCMSQPDQ